MSNTRSELIKEFKNLLDKLEASQPPVIIKDYSGVELLLEEYKALLYNAEKDVAYYKFAIDFLEEKPQILQKKKHESLREHYRSVMEYLRGR